MEGLVFDFKKEYKEFYLPPKKPEIIKIPKMNFIAVRGKGNPNYKDGEYQKALQTLYTVAFTLKMNCNKNAYKIDGCFKYVVPPLEGFWWMPGSDGIDYCNKEKFCWISIIRLPDFIRKCNFERAVSEASEKKKTDLSKTEFFTYDEGECVQCMHTGSFDSEPTTIMRMKEYAELQGYEIDITDSRYHHEIYLTDARRCAAEKMRTVIRCPIKMKK